MWEGGPSLTSLYLFHHGDELGVLGQVSTVHGFQLRHDFLTKAHEPVVLSTLLYPVFNVLLPRFIPVGSFDGPRPQAECCGAQADQDGQEVECHAGSVAYAAENAKFLVRPPAPG